MAGLQSRLDEFKKAFESGAPPYKATREAIETMHRATTELKASGLERYTRSVHKKLNLTFDILTDLHLRTAGQFRLVFVLPDYLHNLYQSFGTTLERFHDESEYRLPMPARYMIDKEGIIRAADVNADYIIRPEPSETVAFLRTLAASQLGASVNP